MITRLAISFLLAVVTLACSKTPTATPLPTAYPRIATADSTFKALPEASLAHIEINEAATAQPDSAAPNGTEWWTVQYPSSGARIYLTVTPTSSAKETEDVAANRLERMQMNAGGNNSELIELTSPGGFHSRILVTPEGTSTPVQIVAVSPNRVVSGAFFAENAATAPADSLRPVVQAAVRDFLHLAKTLK